MLEGFEEGGINGDMIIKDCCSYCVRKRLEGELTRVEVGKQGR
jgi:hypothetical protein